MQIGDGFYQGQTQACSLRTARRISPIESVEYAREMLWWNSTAGVFDGQFGAIRFGLGSDGNFPTIRSEAERVVEKITQSAIEQSGVGINLAVTFAGNGNASLFRDRPIISGDLFDRGARGKDIPFDLPIHCFCAREK